MKVEKSWRESLLIPIVICVVLVAGVGIVSCFWNDQSHASLMGGILGFVASMALALLTWLYVSSNEANFRTAREMNIPRIFVTDAKWAVQLRNANWVIVPASGVEQRVVEFKVTAVVTNRSAAVTTTVSIGDVRLDTNARVIKGGRSNYFVVDGRNVSVLTLPPGASVELRIDGDQTLTELTEQNFPSKAFIQLKDLVTEQTKEFEVITS